MEIKPKKKWYKEWWVWLLAIVIIGAIVINQLNNKTKKEEENKVTYENFNKVIMGSKYDDVKALLGEGKETISAKSAGVKSIIYTWHGYGDSGMNVSVENGEVIGKMQTGLQIMDAQITLEKYEQVKEGMSYDEVKAIAGEGQLTSQRKVVDGECVEYRWVNKDGSIMTGTFTNGKLDMKDQFNLK